MFSEVGLQLLPTVVCLQKTMAAIGNIYPLLHCWRCWLPGYLKKQFMITGWCNQWYTLTHLYPQVPVLFQKHLKTGNICIILERKSFQLFLPSALQRSMSFKYTSRLPTCAPGIQWKKGRQRTALHVWPKPVTWRFLYCFYQWQHDTWCTAAWVWVNWAQVKLNIQQ